MGFAAPVSGSWATPEAMTRVAQRAEQLGYSTLWTFQRLLVPSELELAPVYQSVTDPTVVLSYLAGLTSRIRLGLAIVNLPFYSPVLLAKQLATLDIVSAGRLDAGLGLGWQPQEFAASGVGYERRGARAEEFLRCLDEIWTAETPEFNGEFYSVPRSRIDPKPVQRPRPPVLLGGAAPAALRRAGRLADGWISSSRADLAEIGTAIATIRGAATDAGRDPDLLRFVVRGVVQVRTAAGADRPPLTGSFDDIRRDLARLAEQGVTEVFVDLNFDPEVGSPQADPAASLARAELALDELAPGTVGLG